MKQLVIKLVQYLHTVLTKTTGAQQSQHRTGVRRWNSNPRFVSTWVWKLSDLSGHQLFHSSNALNQRTQNFVLSAQGSFRTLPPRSLTWGLGTQSILSSAANIHFTLEGSSLSTFLIHDNALLKFRNTVFDVLLVPFTRILCTTKCTENRGLACASSVAPKKSEDFRGI